MAKHKLYFRFSILWHVWCSFCCQKFFIHSLQLQRIIIRTLYTTVRRVWAYQRFSLEIFISVCGIYIYIYISLLAITCLQWFTLLKSQGYKRFSLQSLVFSVDVKKPRTSLETELRSCVKVEVDVLGSSSLIILMVSADVKQHWTNCVKVEVDFLDSLSLVVSLWI